jgi:hypothetical protein
MGKGLEIKRALLDYNENQRQKKTIKEVAEKIYPKLAGSASKVTGIINGKVKVNREEVLLFCQELKCDPNKLFGHGKKD